MQYALDKVDIEALKTLKPNIFKDKKVSDNLFDDMQCYNVWQDNAYLSPEQLINMEESLVFLVTLAIVSEVFSPFNE